MEEIKRMSEWTSNQASNKKSSPVKNKDDDSIDESSSSMTNAQF